MSKIKDYILQKEYENEVINDNDLVKIITNTKTMYKCSVKNVLHISDKVIQYKKEYKSTFEGHDGYKIITINMENVESITIYHDYHDIEIS